MYNKEVEAISQVINDYFMGLYNGDIDRLKQAFHPTAILWGDINGSEYMKSLEEFTTAVSNRKSPADNNEPFNMTITGIEVLGNNAMTKLHVPMLGNNYHEFISLSKVSGRWWIVNKLFTNISHG